MFILTEMIILKSLYSFIVESDFWKNIASWWMSELEKIHKWNARKKKSFMAERWKGMEMNCPTSPLLAKFL